MGASRVKHLGSVLGACGARIRFNGVGIASAVTCPRCLKHLGIATATLGGMRGGMRGAVKGGAK